MNTRIPTKYEYYKILRDTGAPGGWIECRTDGIAGRRRFTRADHRNLTNAVRRDFKMGLVMFNITASGAIIKAQRMVR